jgi:iron complex outermembrane receptor protein
LNYRFGSQGTNFSNIERIEVFRGPASVLFGQGSPGGTINVVTRQPLRDPFYSVEASIGSYDFYRGAIDLSGPLDDSRTALYRLTASYENADSFIDFINRDNPSVAGALRFDISDSTTLILDAEYNRIDQSYYGGIPAIGTVLPNRNGEIPRDRNPGEPDGIYTPEIVRVGYNLEHQFSENWLLRNAFYYSHFSFRNRNSYFIRSLDPDQRTIQRGVQDSDDSQESFDLFSNIVGNFSTGSIRHQLLFGIDLNRFDYYESEYEGRVGTPLDLFNPNYSSERFDVLFTGDEDNLTDSLGIYIQDQIRLTDNLILLLGGRFDAFGQTQRDFLTDTEQFQSGDAFSPRVGIVYQPIPPISLYASYSRSFTPTIGRSINGEQFAPGRGTQYEIGVKADINDSLSMTLALYDLTRSNVLTADPDNPGFSVQTGEQNSRGVELNVAGEILPGWNIIAGYAYTDARVTEDNTIETGNRLNNVPENSFSLWTSYQLQEGDLEGLGFGLGLFFIGDRQGDLANTFSLPSYLRTDAAIFYDRGQFRAALNIRNLFDIEYFEAATSTLRVYPAEPFTIQGTLSWEF